MRLFSGVVFSVDRIKVRIPGSKSYYREIVTRPDAVMVVPLIDNNNIVMVREFRAVIGKWILALPAGTMEKGETPTGAAKRELLEETGFRAGKLERLVDVYSSPGFTDEVAHIFMATELKRGKQRLDETERIKVVPMSIERVETLTENGSINDAKTLGALLLFLRRKRKKGGLNR